MTTLEPFDLIQLPAVPWKNGGGVTREVVRIPLGADLDAFDWRVSVAEVATDGSFSLFAGVDRIIALLDGAGVHLHASDGSVDHRLERPLEPFSFAGEAPIEASLIAGPSRDFNVMTRRSAARAELAVLRGVSDLGESTAGTLLAISGRWELEARGAPRHEIAPATGIWWNDRALAWRVTPLDGESALIAVTVTHLSG